MKKNVMLLSCAALLALALAGCAQSTAQADYIGTDAAKAIALEAAGIGEADATFTTAELETRNNTPYYEVDFTAGGQEYDYDIDALTGTVIAGSQQAAGSTDGSTGDTAITADKAKEIAAIALDRLEIDHLGLETTDRRMLETIIRNYAGGPVGLDTLAAAVGEEAITLEDVYEPYLMQLGFLARTPRGRCATALAYGHLGLKMPGEDAPGQLTLG